MFDRLGQEIITLLEPLEYITLRGGLVELVNQTDGENRSVTPQSKIYVDGVWNGDYQNLSPDHSETCIVFSEFQDYQVEERTARYDRFNLRFRLIVWFNEAKIDYEGYAGEKISKDLIKKVRTLNLYKTPKINLESMTADPARIWSAYSFKPDDALFMAPYRTFALTFILKAYEMTKCDDVTQIDTVC
jgi:hypothetical protein